MSLVVPNANALALRLSDVSPPPPGNAVDLHLQRSGAISDASFRVPPLAFVGVAWRQRQSLTLQRRTSLRTPAPQQRMVAPTWGRAQTQPKALKPNWRQAVAMALLCDLPWHQQEPLRKSQALNWLQLHANQHAHRPVWSRQSPWQRDTDLYWSRPPPQQAAVAAGFSQAQALRRALCASFHQPRGQSLERLIPWGQGSGRLPTIHKPPSIFEPPARLPPPRRLDAPMANALGLHLLCRQGKPATGNTLSLPLRRIQCLESFIMVHNQAGLFLGDGRELFPLALEVSLDRDSWAWAFTATLALNDLALIESDSAPHQLRLTLNGLDWSVYAESYAERDVFGNRALQISGRSLSAELGTGFALPASRDEQSDLSAFQLAAQELVGTGWVLSQHPNWIDYPVPGGNFNYRELTPIDAISRIVQASGAVLLPLPDRKELRITPRYPVPAWQRATTPPDKELSLSMVRARDGQYQPEPLRRGIYLAGTSADGELVRVQRSGSDGAPWANMITDPLITHPQAGLQRGLAELSISGKRKIENLSIPLMTKANEPGLLLPGERISILQTPNQSWTGQVLAVSLSVRWQQDGLAIDQTVTLEHYLDE